MSNYETEIAVLRAQLSASRAELAMIVNSRSWRVTAPLRSGPSLLAKRLRKRPRQLRATAADDDCSLLEKSGLFDAEFYLASYPGVCRSAGNAIEHYVSTGANQGLDPNPLFNTSFYLRSNPDVARSGANPLAHYVRTGATLGCDPNPFFNTSLYASDLGVRSLDGSTPLAHYLSRPEVASGLRRLLRSEHGLSWTQHTRQLVQSTFCYFADRKFGPVWDNPRRPEATSLIVLVADENGSDELKYNALGLISELQRNHATSAVALLTGDGPLAGEFLALAPTVVLDSDGGSDSIDGAAAEMDLFGHLHSQGASAAVCFGASTARLAERLTSCGFHVVTILDELPSTAALVDRIVSGSSHVIVPRASDQERINADSCARPASIIVRPPTIGEPNTFVGEREFARLQMAKHLGIPADKPVILSTGRASAANGFDLFVQLLLLLNRNHSDESVQFVWTGDRADDFTATILGDAMCRGVAAQMHVVDAQPLRPLLYVGADIYVSLRRGSSLPVDCLEAMEAGLPVVAFESEGVCQAIHDGAGIVVPYLDLAAIADALLRLIEDTELRTRIGTLARLRAIQCFGPHNYAEFLLDVLSGRAFAS